MDTNWIERFDCFLFDFDGLLVNTERLHFLAYEQMCEELGISWGWDFHRFCKAAHFDASGIKNALYEEFPSLREKHPVWGPLYNRKKSIYQERLNAGQIELMPGVKNLLEELAKKDLVRCVVTHSPKEQVEVIKKALPLLHSIPHWITREDYQNPKPAPDPYLLALEKYAQNKKRVVGFEDSFRGLKALQAAEVPTRMLICSKDHPQVALLHPDDAFHFESMDAIS